MGGAITTKDCNVSLYNSFIFVMTMFIALLVIAVSILAFVVIGIHFTLWIRTVAKSMGWFGHWFEFFVYSIEAITICTLFTYIATNFSQMVIYATK
jgi:hypothetical protein